MLEIAKAIKPQVIMIENVPGFASLKSGAIRSIRAKLGHINRTEGTNYRLNVWELNALNYGVPQIRNRIICVAFRDGLLLAPPIHTHSAQPDTCTYPVLNCWDAIGDLDNGTEAEEVSQSAKWLDLLPSIPEGSNYLFHTSRGDGEPIFGWRTRYWSFLLKLAKALPSWTLSASPGPTTGPFHWSNRRLSIREQARLQTFPDNWRFAGNYRVATSQIGNAVPCALASAVGAHILESLQISPKEDWQRSLIPSKRVCPEPHPTEPAPMKYRGCSIPADHPGPGKGPGAKNRVLNSTEVS